MRPFPLLAAAFALAACASAEYRDTSVPIEPVARVDLDRYAGKWYEIARFPNWFEEGCAGVTAEYSLRPDGRVDVRSASRLGRSDLGANRKRVERLRDALIKRGVVSSVDPSPSVEP